MKRPAHRRRDANRSRPQRYAVGATVLLFVALAELWCWLTPAWEANDEPDHVDNVQIVASGRLPIVGDNVEAGQPPLYYVAAAGWQTILGIEAVRTDPRRSSEPASPGSMVFLHDYRAGERDAAFAVHLLRQVSVLCGALTVLLTYLIARELGAEWRLSSAVALTVAVWPRFAVISSAVQNDSLMTALCAGALLSALRWANGARRGSSSHLPAAAFGVLAGAAVLTKYTAIPVVTLIFLATSCRVLLSRQLQPGTRLLQMSIAAVAGVGVCGWYFLRNQRLYGELLATEANNRYFNEVLPALAVPVSWTDQQRFLVDLPRYLMETLWYVGGWNQNVLPFGVTLFLTLVASASLGGALRWGIRTLAGAGRETLLNSGFLEVLTALLGAAIALLVIAKASTQIQGRYLFTAIAPMAICLVVGGRELAAQNRRLESVALFVWPTLLALTHLYAMHLYLWPARGL